MRKMTLITMILGLTTIFNSCEKIDLPKDTPSCVKKMIKKDKETNCLNEVHLYEYKGENVFVFQPNCPDLGVYIVNEECETICSSFWGGGTTCPDFDSLATYKKTIWTK